MARHTLAALLIAVALFAAGCTGAASPFPSFVMAPAVTPPPLGARDTVYDPPRPAPALRLTGRNDVAVDLATLRGTPVFVYFGYTHCPDICPTTLADLRAAIALAGVSAKVLFVTVDPARDTPAAMAQYADYYQAGFIGLSGSQAEIAAAASAWGVTYRRLEPDANGNYAMAHSTDAYLVDGSGMLRNHIFFGAPAELIAAILRSVAG